MIPLVLVKSYGQECSNKIIKDILKAYGESTDSFVIQYDNLKIEAYKINITTKYYKTQIALFEWDDITNISSDLLDYIEGCIIYFDAENENFLLELESLHKFIEYNNVEASYLITNKFCDNGISYNGLKRICSPQVVILDLSEEEEHNIYGELIELLRNNLWSNIKDERINSNISPNNQNCKVNCINYPRFLIQSNAYHSSYTLCEQEDIKTMLQKNDNNNVQVKDALQITEGITIEVRSGCWKENVAYEHRTCLNKNTDDSENEDIDTQLNDFENLMESIRNFKVISHNLKREEVLNTAEQLATHFAKILKED